VEASSRRSDVRDDDEGLMSRNFFDVAAGTIDACWPELHHHRGPRSRVHTRQVEELSVVSGHAPIRTPLTPFPAPPQLAGTMSDKSKGISLRKKRDKDKKKGPPTISAPRQISAPMPAGAGIAAPSISSSGRPSTESSRSRQNRGDVPRERPQRADRTADLVKRRYSQKITTLPSDFSNGLMPDMPQIPTQYREKDPARDARPTTSGEGRGLRVDMKALRDPNLRAEQCKNHGKTRVLHTY
jgi:hypothetical protein